MNTNINESLIEKIKAAVVAKTISTYTTSGGGRYIASGELYDFIRQHSAAPDVERVRKAIYDASNSDEMITVDEATKAAIAAMGDASNRKTEGCTGTTGSATPASASTSSSASDQQGEISVVDDELLNTIIQIARSPVASEPLIRANLGVFLRPYLRTTKPVSADLKKCGTAARDAWLQTHTADLWQLVGKAVLDAAGVSYGD